MIHKHLSFTDNAQSVCLKESQKASKENVARRRQGMNIFRFRMKSCFGFMIVYIYREAAIITFYKRKKTERVRESQIDRETER